MVRTKKKKITRKRIMRGGSGNVNDTCDIPNVKQPFICNGKEVYEWNNQAIGIVYNREKYEFYTITPLMLSVDTMQLAAKTGSISIEAGKGKDTGNYYIGFINNFPSLRIEEDFNYAYKTRPLEKKDNRRSISQSIRKSRQSSSQHINQSSSQSIHDTKQEAQWFNVYEDEDTLNDFNFQFQLIENYHACENNKKKVETYVLQTRENSKSSHQYLDSIIIPKYYKKDEKGHTIEPIYISTCTNLETYEYLTQKVRELIDIIKNKTAPQPEEPEEPQQQHSEPSNLTLKLKDLEIILHKFLSNEELSIAVLNKLSIEQLLLIRKIAISKVIYRANIKFEDGTKEYITENIRWVCSNALWVEKYLELEKPVNLLSNTTLQSKEYECDLSGLDDKFVIVDEFVNSSEGDGQNYVIVGYPDKNMREHILNFWQLKTDNSNKELYDSFNGLDKDLSKKIADLYDSYKTDEKDKINYTKHNGNNLYKLYMSLRKSIFEYVKNRYNDLNKEKEDKRKVSDEELKFFNDNFETNAKAYFQHIALKYLPKPMVFIKYVFLVFKKQQSDGKLIPMVFNVKEINPNHKPILKRVEKLIKHELPYRFGILSDVEYNNREGNEKDPFDDEYKLFYSRYRYGKFFHITTEYIHTMSNISDKAHGYVNSITLEELIYSSGLLSNFEKPFFEDVKLEYEVREHQINNYFIIQSQIKKIIERKQNNISDKSNHCKEIENRSKKVFCLYERKKEINHTFKITLKSKGNTIIISQETIKNMKFILMFKSISQEYIFIYRIDENFYKLVLKSNMKELVEDILKNLDLKDNTIKFEKNKSINLYSVVSNEILSEEDYKNIFQLNPLVLKNFKRPDKTSDSKFDTYYYYSTDLLDIKKLQNYIAIMMISLYNTNIHIPVIIENYLKNYNTTYNNNTIHYNTDSNHFSDCVKNKNCLNIVNKIYYNHKNCGYNFIESIDDKQGKITVYIYPYKDNRYKYLGNYMDLDMSSIKMLKEIKNLYSFNNEYIIFLHKTTTIFFYCLHFHIIKKSEYERTSFSYNSKGSYYIQDITIEELINKIETQSNYYLNSNFSFIKLY